NFFEGHNLLLGGVFYVVSIPPLVLLERNRPLTRTRYYCTFTASLVGTILSCLAFIHKFVPFVVVAYLYILYLSIGCWVLCVVWFYVLVRKNKNASLIMKYYSNATVFGINGGLL